MKALILCGGKGDRLKPLTESVPKPLVPIKGRPILSYILKHLKSYNVTDIVVASGYKAEKIDQYFEKKANIEGLKITIVNSGDVDIIQRIRDAAPHLNDDFLLVYGDTLSDVNIEELKDFHHSSPGKVTVTLWQMRSPFGILEVGDSGLVESYLEKPVIDKWINIGYFYFSKEMCSSFEGFNSYEEYLNSLVEAKALSGFKHSGKHITVNTKKELDEAEVQVDDLLKEIGDK